MSSGKRAKFSWVSFGERGRGVSEVVPTGLIVLHSLTHDDSGFDDGPVSTPDDTEDTTDMPDPSVQDHPGCDTGEIPVKTVDDSKGSINQDHPPADDELAPVRTVISGALSDEEEVSGILCHIKSEEQHPVDDVSSTIRKESRKIIRSSPTYLWRRVCLDHSYAAGETSVTETTKMPSAEQGTYTDKSLPVNDIPEKSKVNTQVADGILDNVPPRGRPHYKSRKISPQKGSRVCTTCGKVSQVSPNMPMVDKIETGLAPFGLDHETGTRDDVAASEQMQGSEMLGKKTDSPASGYKLRTTTDVTPEPVEKEIQHYVCDSCAAVFGGINNYISGSELEKLVETILPENDGKLASSSPAGLQMLRWRVHVCNQCGDYFPSTSALGQHKKTHLGTKPYVCEYCGKRFSANGRLSQHMKIHTGVKPHQCDECGKCFVRNNKLTAHKRTHTGEKPYMCFDCGKCFFDSSNKKRHIKNSCPLRSHSSFMGLSVTKESS